MNESTFKSAVVLDGRIRNLSAALDRVTDSNAKLEPPHDISLVGLPSTDQRAIAELVLDYLNARLGDAERDFAAL